MSDLYKFGYTLDETIKTMRDIIDTGNHDRMFLDTYYWLKMLSEYREIGTVEECREAMEKQKAKKPLLVSKKKKKIMEGDYVDVICPSCQGRIFGCFLFYPWNDSQREHEFCKSCGQAIQWDENLEENADEKN